MMTSEIVYDLFSRSQPLNTKIPDCFRFCKKRLEVYTILLKIGHALIWIKKFYDNVLKKSYQGRELKTT